MPSPSDDRCLRDDWVVRDDAFLLRRSKTSSSPLSLPNRKSSVAAFVDLVVSPDEEAEMARFFEGRTTLDALADDDPSDEGVVEAGRLPRGKAVGC